MFQRSELYFWKMRHERLKPGARQALHPCQDILCLRRSFEPAHRSGLTFCWVQHARKIMISWCLSSQVAQLIRMLSPGGWTSMHIIVGKRSTSFWWSHMFRGCMHPATSKSNLFLCPSRCGVLLVTVDYLELYCACHIMACMLMWSYPPSTTIIYTKIELVIFYNNICSAFKTSNINTWHSLRGTNIEFPPTQNTWHIFYIHSF